MTTAARVHVVVPDGIDDPLRPSGGNVYDRQVCDGLTALGWDVREHAVPGRWPSPGRVDEEQLAEVVDGVPDGEVVLIDGLVASAAASVLVPRSVRRAVVVLVHLPLGHGEPERRRDERTVLAAASVVVATSQWTAAWLRTEYGLADVRVVHPGVDAAAVAAGTRDGGALLCVGPVTPAKGHDILVRALSQLADLPWHSTWAGSLDLDPPFVAGVRDEIERAGLGARIDRTGPLTGPPLEASYASADVLVLASRFETYGMVLTEALARGLPVVASDVGGVHEALGPDGDVPGLLVPPGDVPALADALRTWLVAGDVRTRLRTLAYARRETLTGWSETVERVAGVLADARR